MKAVIKVIIKENKKNDIVFININNENGLTITLCSFGASIYDLKFIDKNNNLESIVLYPSNINDFYFSDGYYGKCVGRFSGRIDDAKCRIDNQDYFLDKNWNGINSLHGGYQGISFQNFSYDIIKFNDRIEVVFSYYEKEILLPGDVNYKITYQIMKNNEINILFEASTNKDTLVNLTNHTYFNLSGDIKENIMNQRLFLFCDKYTVLNNNLITTKIDYVNDIFDFRKGMKIGKHINDEYLQNHTARGYDHCWLKEDTNNDLIGVILDEKSGRRLSVYSSYPAIVCYAGCYPKDFDYNHGIKIDQYYSLCLECQYVPNGINMEGVNKAILKKEDRYNHYIKYKFEVVNND